MARDDFLKKKFNLPKPCPVCGETKAARLDATGGAWVSLTIDICGSVKPRVCLNCGTVYLEKDELERIKELGRYIEDGK